MAKTVKNQVSLLSTLTELTSQYEVAHKENLPKGTSVTIEERTGDDGVFQVAVLTIGSKKFSCYLSSIDEWETGEVIDYQEVELIQLTDKNTGEILKTRLARK